MPGIVDLDERRLVEIVCVHDTTVTFVVFSMQQCIEVLHEMQYLIGAGGGGWYRLSDRIQIPPSMAIHFPPKSTELFPRHQAEQ